MEKRILFLLLVCFSCPALLFAAHEQPFGDLRAQGMGGAGVALTGSYSSFPLNPAALHVQKETVFRLSSGWAESIVPSSYEAAEPIWWMQKPASLLDFMVNSNHVALSLGLGYSLDDRRVTEGKETVEFDAYNDSLLQLSAAYGWEHFSIGMQARGGNALIRPQISIQEESAVIDYLANTYLERYQSAPDTRYFSVGAGVLLSYQWISIGMKSDSVFVMDYETNELALRLTDVLDELSIGLACTSPVYTKDNELRRVVANGAFDVTDIGGSEASVRTGVEVKVQLSNDYWIAVRGGYAERRGDSESLFALDGSGTASCALAAQLVSVTIDLVAVFPVRHTSDDAISVKTGLFWVL